MTTLATSAGKPWAACVPCSAPLLAPGAERTARVQLAKLGEWKGHALGAFELTVEHLAAMVEAARKRVSDISIDWNHASLGDPEAPASGWLRPLSLSIENGDDGQPALFGDVSWTERAADKIRAEEFRYFSPVIAFEGLDRATGEPVLAELLAGGLTNDPFLDGMRPVALSRLWALNTGEPMDPNETPAEPAAPSAGDDAKLAKAGKLIMKTLGVSSVDEAIAYLEANADAASLLEALMEDAGGPDVAAEDPEMPAMMAANRALSAEVKSLSRSVADLKAKNEAAELRAAETMVRSHFPDLDDAGIARRVNLSRNSPADYEELRVSLGTASPPTGRQVQLNRAAPADDAGDVPADFSPDERQMLVSLSRTKANRDSVIKAIRNRRS